MRNYIATLAVIIFALTFLGVDAAKEVRKSEIVALGESDNAFIKNLPQDYCKRPRSGGLRQANGTQIFTGVCSNTPQGEIPRVENVPSTLIISPQNNQKIKSGQKFKVQIKISNFQPGFFSDPALTYNAFPQKLNKRGQIQGHSHIVIQSLGRNGQDFPDSTKFAFFKGLNDPAKNGGRLEVEVTDGLKERGIYRICTMIASFSHQCLVLPKAQRGSSDDCIRMQIV